MNGQVLSTGSVCACASASRPGITTPPAPAMRSIRSPPNGSLLQRQYRKLIRTHLDRLLDKLFAEFTHLHFHVVWAPSPPRAWHAQTLPTGCSVCCRLSGSPLLKDCQLCGPRQLTRALSLDGGGLCFTCRLGVRNYWLPIRVRSETLGIAYLQALDRSPTPPRARRPSARVRPHPLPQVGARFLARPEFTRAARFLRLIVQYAETASLADLRKADLTNAGRAVVALEKEQARLHESLKQHLPALPVVPRRSGLESRADQKVQRLLECIEHGFDKSITLRQCAGSLGMNAAYASALFSRAVGVPFKTHLTEWRLAKAKTLLGDPAKTASEVAGVVGYASENRFRIAFKKATGLSPKLWRETMQANPPQSPRSTS